MEESQGNETGPYDINTNIRVMKRRFLVTELMEATAHNYTSFTHDIIARELKKRRIRAYRFDGYFVSVGSMTDYYNCNMELLDSAVRKQLFNVPGRPVLTKVRNSPPTKYAESAVVKNSLIADGSPEIDLRGELADDAWFMLDKYLDSALIAKVPTVRVIHGKGTGALRKRIWQELQKDKRVSSFRSGAYGEGDTGVTVIELKIK